MGRLGGKVAIVAEHLQDMVKRLQNEMLVKAPQYQYATYSRPRSLKICTVAAQWVNPDIRHL